MEKKNRSMFDLSQEFVELLHAARDGFDEETGEMDPAIEAAFDAHGEEVQRKVVGTAYVLLRLDKEEEIVDDEIKRLQARKKRIKNGHARLKERLRKFMRDTKTTKVETPSIGVTLGSPGKGLKILDESMIPEEFMSKPEPPAPKPMRNEILKKLKEKDGEVPGCILVETQGSLTIR